MKKLHLLLSVLFLIYWGCEDLYYDYFGPKVTLWGEEYSIKNTTKLDLQDSGLSGSIPPEIGNLINLTLLNLENSDLTGEIPPEIGNLTNLVSLNLYSCRLTGEIPPEIGNLTNLETLNLRVNDLKCLCSYTLIYLKKIIFKYVIIVMF